MKRRTLALPRGGKVSPTTVLVLLGMVLHCDVCIVPTYVFRPAISSLFQWSSNNSLAVTDTVNCNASCHLGDIVFDNDAHSDDTTNKSGPNKRIGAGTMSSNSQSPGSRSTVKERLLNMDTMSLGGVLVEIINQTTLDLDMNLSTLERVTHHVRGTSGTKGAWCRPKLPTTIDQEGNEIIKVVIIGGSVPYGSELHNIFGQRYSAVMTRLLQTASLPIRVVNLAQGGCGTQCWISQIDATTTPDLFDASIVLVDVSINDQELISREIVELRSDLLYILQRLPQRPRLAFLEEFKISNRLQKVSPHCNESTGARLNIHSSNKYDYNTTIHYCQHWWDLQTHAELVLNKYQIPFISYRDAIWPIERVPPLDLFQYWNGRAHPDWKGHALLAKFVLYLISQVLLEQEENICSSTPTAGVSANNIIPIPNVSHSNQLISCFNPAPVRYAQSKEPNAFIPTKTTPPFWEYSSPNNQAKFGWAFEMTPQQVSMHCSNPGISSSSHGNDTHDNIEMPSIEFLLGHVERKSVLFVHYMASYSLEWGTVELSLVSSVDDSNNIIPSLYHEINSFHPTRHHTMPEVYIVQNPIQQQSITSLESTFNLTLRLRPLHLCIPEHQKYGFKWKLIGYKVCPGTGLI